MWVLFVGFLLSLILVLLLGPFRIRVCFDKLQRTSSMHVRITSWKMLFGVEWTKKEGEAILHGILFKRAWILRKKKSDPGKRDTPAGEREKTIQKRRFWCMERHIFRRLLRWIRRFFCSIRLDCIDIEGDFGTGDPALTGEVFGFLQMLQSMGGKGFRVALIPHFYEIRYDGKIALTARFILLRLLWVVVITGVEFGWMVWKCRI